MLRTYPDTLCQYAVAGIVHGSSLACAEDAHRLLRFARDAAQREREQALQDAVTLRSQALSQGYRDGLVRAMKCLLPLLESLQQEQHALAAAMHAQAQHAVQRMLASPPVLVPQLLAACEQWAPVEGGGPQPVLHVPEHEHALLQALRAEPALDHLAIRPARREHVLLEVGGMAYALDLQQPLMEAAEDALQRQLPRLQPVLSELAAAFCRRLQDDLAARTQRERFTFRSAD